MFIYTMTAIKICRVIQLFQSSITGLMVHQARQSKLRATQAVLKISKLKKLKFSSSFSSDAYLKYSLFFNSHHRVHDHDQFSVTVAACMVSSSLFFNSHRRVHNYDQFSVTVPACMGFRLQASGSLCLEQWQVSGCKKCL